MSAYGITLRAIVANLFGLKQTSPPAPAAVNTIVLPQPSDEQLTVPGYYVSSPLEASCGASAQAAALPETGSHSQRDALGAALKAARDRARSGRAAALAPRSRVSSTG